MAFIWKVMGGEKREEQGEGKGKKEQGEEGLAFVVSLLPLVGGFCCFLFSFPYW